MINDQHAAALAEQGGRQDWNHDDVISVMMIIMILIMVIHPQLITCYSLTLSTMMTRLLDLEFKLQKTTH